jgi:hypothetical protein
MRHEVVWSVAAALLLGYCAAGSAQEAIAPIRKVEIGRDREFLVNGKPFFPIMGWLQDAENLPKLKAVGMNCIAGYWRPADPNEAKGKTADTYCEQAFKAGLYFLPPFDPSFAEEMRKLKSSTAVLAWMQNDEPDSPVTRSDAQIVPGKGLIVNNSRPLYMMLDGKSDTSAVLDPMAGASFTIKLKSPVTAVTLAVQNSTEASLAVAKEVVFAVGDKEILKVTLERKPELQKFELKEPATFQEITVKVLSVYPEANAWGAIAEIQAFDEEGRNRLLSETRKEPRESPGEVMAKYKSLKAFDPARPMFMTVTDFFIHDPNFYHWWTREQQDKLYPEMVKAADVVGFDHYPIYGWNQPTKIGRVAQGMTELREYAGRDKPVYQWIEVMSGGKFGDHAAPVTGVEIRNEVWQAIIRGATAIGYFTHRFQPTFAEFGPPEENQKAIKEINEQIARLTPVLCAADAKVQPKIEIEGGLAAQCLAKEAEHGIVIFAQNFDGAGKAGKGTILLEGLKAGTKIEVVDESRALAAEDGKFTDDFGRLAVHIYRVMKQD